MSGQDVQSSFKFAQTYDDAVMIALDLKGLQAEVRQVALSAHHLHLVLSQGIKFILKANVFFTLLCGCTSVYFSNPARDWQCLKNLAL